MCLLLRREKAIISIFERATYSVVNVFDVALQVRVRGSSLHA